MKLYVGNIDHGTTEEALREFFAQSGEVSAIKIITDRDTGRSRGFAFIEMASKNDGIKAISQLNGKELEGRELKVNEAQEKRKNQW